MKRTRLHPEAQNDLRGVRAYTIRAWGKAQAKRYLADIRQHLSDLAAKPLLRPLMDERSDGVRRSRSGRHLIIYVPVSDGIEVVRILHERMDIDAHLDG